MSESIAAAARAVHQQVREQVEREHPTCRVTLIEERVRSRYRRRRFPYEPQGIEPASATEAADYVLAGMDISFDVEAVSLDALQPSIKCRVIPTENGELRVDLTQYYLGKWED